MILSSSPTFGWFQETPVGQAVLDLHKREGAQTNLEFSQHFLKITFSDISFVLDKLDQTFFSKMIY